MRILKTMLLAGAMAGLTAAGALAAGSGGGGAGASLPSASAPNYDPAAEYARAVAAIQAKDYKAAIKAAKRVTGAVPRSGEAWRLLAVAEGGAGNWRGARRAYEKAIKYKPDDATSHAGLAMVLARLQDPKAQAELDWLKARAAACADTCEEAASLKAMVREVETTMSGGKAAPQPSAALEQRSLLFAEAGDAAYLQAVGLINEKRYDEALAALAEARTAFGPHPDVLTYQGYAWRRKGDLDKAEAYYRQALAVAPDHRGATEYYGELKVERGDVDGARLMLAKLETACAFGCAEAEELRRWIDAGGEPPR